MAKKEKHRKLSPNKNTDNVFRNKRTNPITGTVDYYFPLEITDSAIREYAIIHGLEIGRARLGFRYFNAVMVPCKLTARVNGAEVFIDTPSNIQHDRYLDMIKDELSAQDAIKQDGRCQIPDGHGGLKRCPCRVKNPKYIPGNNMSKTLPIRCEGCKYEPYRQAHTTIPLSALDHEDEAGEMAPYEIEAPANDYAAEKYLKLRKNFLSFVEARDSKLLPLAIRLTAELTKAETARDLNMKYGTVSGHIKKLQQLLENYLDTVITI